MGQIIEFRPRSKQMNRTEALVKGKIENYRCDSCLEYFEVIDDNLPDKCPHCGVKIDEWLDEDNE